MTYGLLEVVAVQLWEAEEAEDIGWPWGWPWISSPAPDALFQSASPDPDLDRSIYKFSDHWRIIRADRLPLSSADAMIPYQSRRCLPVLPLLDYGRWAFSNSAVAAGSDWRLPHRIGLLLPSAGLPAASGCCLRPGIRSGANGWERVWMFPIPELLRCFFYAPQSLRWVAIRKKSD